MSSKNIEFTNFPSAIAKYYCRSILFDKINNFRLNFSEIIVENIFNSYINTFLNHVTVPRSCVDIIT